ncbi:hypothetical protein ACFL35_21665 [Candidatus Riflebacteria bacterium]
MLKYHKVFEIPLKELQWDEGLLFLLIACFPLIWSVNTLPGGWSIVPVVVSWLVLYQIAKFLGHQTSLEIDSIEQMLTLREEVPFSLFSFIIEKIRDDLLVQDFASETSGKSSIRKIEFEKITSIVIDKITRHDRHNSVTQVWISGGYQYWYRISISHLSGEQIIIKESLHEEEGRMLAENLSKIIGAKLIDNSVNPEVLHEPGELMKVENIRITKKNRDRDELIVSNHSGSPNLHYKPQSISLIQRDHFHIICKWNNRSYLTFLLLIFLVLPLLVYNLLTIFDLLHLSIDGFSEVSQHSALSIWEKMDVVGLCPLFLGIFFLCIKFLRDCLGSAMISIDPNRMHVISCPIFFRKHHLVNLDEVASIRMHFGLAPQITFLTDREEFSVFGSTSELQYIYWEMSTYFQSRLQRKLDGVDHAAS